MEYGRSQTSPEISTRYPSRDITYSGAVVEVFLCALLIKLNSTDQSKQMSQLRDLVALAYVDGELAESEKTLIYKIGKELEIPSEKVAFLIKNPEKIDFHPPETEEEKLEQFYNCIRMILVDGKTQAAEIDFCKTIATGLGFTSFDIYKMLSEHYNETI